MANPAKDRLGNTFAIFTTDLFPQLLKYIKNYKHGLEENCCKEQFGNNCQNMTGLYIRQCIASMLNFLNLNFFP